MIIRKMGRNWSEALKIGNGGSVLISGANTIGSEETKLAGDETKTSRFRSSNMKQHSTGTINHRADILQELY